MNIQTLAGILSFIGISAIPAQAATLHSAILAGDLASTSMSVSRSTTSFAEDNDTVITITPASKGKTSKGQDNTSVFITAYTSRPEETDSTPYLTASGTWVRDGVVASNFLPFGTRIRIPELFGNKIFTVEDRMNPRYGHRIDIWMPDYDSARIFGIRRAAITVLDDIAVNTERSLTLK